MKKKSAAFYSPYWQIAGGGERYLFQIAKALSENYRIYFIGQGHLLKKAREVFGIELRGEFLDPELMKGDAAKRFRLMKRFDLFFHTTDGSLFFPFARKNILIIQSPKHIPADSIFNHLKLFNWQTVCYSDFMKGIIEERLKIKVKILSPAVNTDMFSYDEKKKKNIILNVGRYFSSDLHQKNQEFLIDFFSRYHQDYFPGWQLILVGNVSENSGIKYLEKLRAKIIGKPVSVYSNLAFSDLCRLYSQAKIYWHAAGFGQNLIKYPEKAEHFGITTLEAMASGAVPVVFRAGGQLDIINNGINGIFWDDEESLLERTAQIAADENERGRLAAEAVIKADLYSLKHLREKVDEILQK